MCNWLFDWPAFQQNDVRFPYHWHFPYATWSLPIGSLAIIVLFVIAAAVLAAYSPAKRMRTMSVTETINEL